MKSRSTGIFASPLHREYICFVQLSRLLEKDETMWAHLRDTSAN